MMYIYIIYIMHVYILGGAVPKEYIPGVQKGNYYNICNIWLYISML
jgi:hypothetical protein